MVCRSIHPGLFGLLLLCPAFSSVSRAVSFDAIVTLGDSLLDDESGGGHSPVIAEIIADRLGISVTKLAVSGSTSTDLISTGQHTTAASGFGAGDLAFLWIGGNDFFDAGTSIAIGNFGFMDTLEANVDTALGTLTGAGMDVVVLNLPDFAKVPGVINAVPSFLLPNFTAASAEWRTRLDTLAVTHGAVVIDIFSLFDVLKDDPAAFMVGGNTPVPAPMFGPISSCPFCVFFDEIHPSAMSSGFIANEVMMEMNDAFDPGGAMPLTLLNDTELFGLVAINDSCNAAREVSGGVMAAAGYNVIPQSSDAVEASCQASGDDDLWFSYVAECDGQLIADTAGSLVDTVISTYETCGGAEIACGYEAASDDAVVTFPVTTGSEYLIRLATVGGNGRYQLNLSCSEAGQVPAASTWGLVVLFLATGVMGTLLAVRRAAMPASAGLGRWTPPAT